MPLFNREAFTNEPRFGIHPLTFDWTRKWDWDILYVHDKSRFFQFFSEADDFESPSMKTLCFTPTLGAAFNCFILRNPRALQLPMNLSHENVIIDVQITHHNIGEISDFFAGVALSLQSKKLPVENCQNLKFLHHDGFAITNSDEILTKPSKQNCFIQYGPKHKFIPNLPELHNWPQDIPRKFKFAYCASTSKISVSQNSTKLGMFSINPSDGIAYLAVISDAAHLSIDIKYQFPKLRKLTDIALAKVASTISQPDQTSTLEIPKSLQTRLFRECQRISQINNLFAK